jgi:hypothetical protein
MEFGLEELLLVRIVLRRKALESAGGHGIGLAEDLITSIRIHAAGWKSIYNEVVTVKSWFGLTFWLILNNN